MSAEHIRYLRLEPESAFPLLSDISPYKAVVVLEADYSIDWQSRVSTWLVESGCRYMMAWGPDCSSWDDSVDHADIETGGLDDDSKFCMTTWHENETLESVFWFAQFCAETSYDEVELTNTMLLHISRIDREREFFDLFAKSRTLAGREGSGD